MPVLPLVGSRMTLSRDSSPRASARSIMARAMRSLTLPLGLLPSSLANNRTRGLGLSRDSSTSGVSPIAATRSAYGPAGRAGRAVGALVAMRLLLPGDEIGRAHV